MIPVVVASLVPIPAVGVTKPLLQLCAFRYQEWMELLACVPPRR